MYSNDFINSDLYINNKDFLDKYLNSYLNALLLGNNYVNNSLKDQIINKLEKNINKYINNVSNNANNNSLNNNGNLNSNEKLIHYKTLFNKLINCNENQTIFGEKEYWIKSLFLMNDDQVKMLITNIDMEKIKIVEIDYKLDGYNKEEESKKMKNHINWNNWAGKGI